MRLSSIPPFIGVLTCKGKQHWLIGPWDIWSNFLSKLSDWGRKYFLGNCPQMNVTASYWWLVKIGWCDVLVSSSNKSLSEPMLTNIYLALCRHKGSTGQFLWCWGRNFQVNRVNLISKGSIISYNLHACIVSWSHMVPHATSSADNFVHIYSEFTECYWYR